MLRWILFAVGAAGAAVAISRVTLPFLDGDGTVGLLRGAIAAFALSSLAALAGALSSTKGKRARGASWWSLLLQLIVIIVITLNRCGIGDDDTPPAIDAGPSIVERDPTPSPSAECPAEAPVTAPPVQWSIRWAATVDVTATSVFIDEPHQRVLFVGRDMRATAAETAPNSYSTLYVGALSSTDGSLLWERRFHSLALANGRVLRVLDDGTVEVVAFIEGELMLGEVYADGTIGYAERRLSTWFFHFDDTGKLIKKKQLQPAVADLTRLPDGQYLGATGGDGGSGLTRLTESGDTIWSNRIDMMWRPVVPTVLLDGRHALVTSTPGGAGPRVATTGLSTIVNIVDGSVVGPSRGWFRQPGNNNVWTQILPVCDGYIWRVDVPFAGGALRPDGSAIKDHGSTHFMIERVDADYRVTWSRTIANDSQWQELYPRLGPVRLPSGALLVVGSFGEDGLDFGEGVGRVEAHPTGLTWGNGAPKKRPDIFALELDPATGAVRHLELLGGAGDERMWAADYRANQLAVAGAFYEKLTLGGVDIVAPKDYPTAPIGNGHFIALVDAK